MPRLGTRDDRPSSDESHAVECIRIGGNLFMLTTVMNVVEREERKFDIGVRTEEGRGRSRIVN